jgi:AcrR family transcriptional regulator
MNVYNEIVTIRTSAARIPAGVPRSASAPNKHQQRTEATRRALLQSARRIFARDGFEACRIEDIAAATGHTRGAFYAHFRTKEDLFFALLEQEGKRRVEELRGKLAGCRSEQDKLRALRSFYMNVNMDREWTMLVLEFKLYALRHPKLRPRLAATYRSMRASFNLEVIVRACDEPRRAALGAILVALTLEHAYDPRCLSRSQTTELLGMLFDTVVTGMSGRRS